MVEDVKPMEPFTLYRRQPQGRRSHTRQIKLGPYLLLQTLGEGEFGKVKLGIHTETGQEFAIKLIRKETVGFSASRLNKVEREIHALRTLKHPYIVKLFNVIETEKYIGIILEYASGGELFEYILAHRCLKEKDARRLFAQLISSVQYMHRKKIVHRDLKLENLLLDRNRNIVVTDFGFANNKQDDLMATSCGSPCYAAPELVVNEGLYAGSAVDIWSCGVILYAMLCGYLPFDDDPCNPDGNNINQLYRYILSTPPSFPKHVSQDAQDLLRQILVADPQKRYTLDEIQHHPWLRPHSSLFDKSDDVLEAEAAVMAEQSFMPNYRKVVWPNTNNNNNNNNTDGSNKEAIPLKDDNGYDEEQGKYKTTQREDVPFNVVQQPRPATVHGAMRRFNLHRGHQTISDRSRKARTAIEQKGQTVHLKSSPPPRRERLLSFFTGKTDANQQQQQQQEQQQQQPQQQQQQQQQQEASAATDETLPVTKLRSKFIASLRVRRKDEPAPGQDGFDGGPVKNCSSISSISATMGTQQQQQSQQQQQDDEQQETHQQESSSLPSPPPQQQQQQQQVEPESPQQLEDEAIALYRQESLHALTRAKTRGQRQRYHSTIGGQSGRRAIAAVRNSIYRKNTTAAAHNKPTAPGGNDNNLAWPSKRHSLDAAALIASRSATPESSARDSATPQKQQQQQSQESAVAAAPMPQQQKSVSRKMMAWIKRKSQGNKQQQQQKQRSFSTSAEQQQDQPQQQQQQSQPQPQQQQQPSPPASAGQQDQEEVVAAKASPSSSASPPTATSPPACPPQASFQHTSHHTMPGFNSVAGGEESRERSDDMLDIRVHHGAVDRAALTSRPPVEIISEVRQILHALGIDCKPDGEYKLKCSRRAAKAFNNNSNTKDDIIDNDVITAIQSSESRQKDTQEEEEEEEEEQQQQQPNDDNNDDTDSKSQTSSLLPNPGHLSATSSFEREQEERRSTSLLSISTDTAMDGSRRSSCQLQNYQQQHPIYGDPSIDSGEEIRFMVEICRFRNLPGLFIADVRRLRGNVWAYKFLYHKLIDLLGLDKGGYYTRTRNTADTVVQKSPFFHQPIVPQASTTTTAALQSPQQQNYHHQENAINRDSAIGSYISP